TSGLTSTRCHPGLTQPVTDSDKTEYAELMLERVPEPVAVLYFWYHFAGEEAFEERLSEKEHFCLLDSFRIHAAVVH
ncbi:hypothetical protein GN156_35115, partial [bacterium LRH843]|nr:hypothetical protein [bacterium LRH843]